MKFDWFNQVLDLSPNDTVGQKVAQDLSQIRDAAKSLLDMADFVLNIAKPRASETGFTIDLAHADYNEPEKRNIIEVTEVVSAHRGFRFMFKRTKGHSLLEGELSFHCTRPEAVRADEVTAITFVPSFVSNGYDQVGKLSVCEEYFQVSPDYDETCEYKPIETDVCKSTRQQCADALITMQKHLSLIRSFPAIGDTVHSILTYLADQQKAVVKEYFRCFGTKKDAPTKTAKKKRSRK